MGKAKVSALYDTGADISCMALSTFREIPIHLRPKKKPVPPVRARGAGNRLLEAVGTYDFDLGFKDRTVSQQITVFRELNSGVILGMDLITDHQLTFLPSRREFRWGDPDEWYQGRCKVAQKTKIPPLTVAPVRVQLKTATGCLAGAQQTVLGQVGHSENPYLTGGPYLMQANEIGQAVMMIHNCSPVAVELDRDELIGWLENVTDCEVEEINPDYIQQLAAVQKEELRQQKNPLLPEAKKFITDNLKCGPSVPPEVQKKYLELVLKHHEVVSRHRFDLGRTDTLMHSIDLKDKSPVYVKQFQIPDAHREEVEKHVGEWLKMGVIEPTHSRYNSPLFAVKKKNGSLRLVQDFRALNNNSHIDKYSMKDVSECIGDIGRAGSTVFSTLDLTAGFWQQMLDPKSRPYTAFTVPGKGQFQWVTTPMGLLGAPASFQRLMETVVRGLNDTLVYIDDLLTHTDSHEKMLEALDRVFDRLKSHKVKINLPKCEFGSDDVAYLGFRLTKDGIKPGTDKLKAVRDTQPPSSVSEIRQFLGLCNFFRTHVKNFAQITAPLTKLTRKDCEWKGGPLPPDALKAFKELQGILVSEPVMAYPRNDRPYALITDASQGDCQKPGGFGAILAQPDDEGRLRAVAYASRRLNTNEENYTPYLLEMDAAVWAMNHFSTYLMGKQFVLYTDHKPLETLGKVHTKTYNRLQLAMQEFFFEIVYKKGSEMPADYLSRNFVDAITLDNLTIREEQAKDEDYAAMKEYLLNGTPHPNPSKRNAMALMANSCFVDDGILWKRFKRPNEPSRVLLMLPRSMRPAAIQDAHGTPLSGHDGVYKTKERLLQTYWWLAMDKDIDEHIKSCHRCQMRKKGPQTTSLLQPMPQTTEPNMRIHADLFGPLVASGRHKKYILTITDAFTKYAEIVALPDKEAATVAEALFDKWICRYGVPIEIVTDRGKEFCNQVHDELWKFLGAAHLTTTAHHPQCNSQAEVFNKTIAKYLSSFVDETTLDWEDFLAPLMFSYNTSFHRSVLNTPHFLTFGVEPRQPGILAPDIRRKFYGSSLPQEQMQRLQWARRVAQANNENATDKAEAYFNLKAEPHQFQPGQLVLLSEHNFLGKNAKLAPKWTGPHRITHLKGEKTAELKTEKGKRTVVSVDRLKPYRDPSSNFMPAELEPEELKHTDTGHPTKKSQKDHQKSQKDQQKSQRDQQKSQKDQTNQNRQKTPETFGSKHEGGYNDDFDDFDFDDEFDVAKNDFDSSSNQQPKTRRPRFQDADRGPPETEKEVLGPDTPWRRKKDEEAFHGWKTPDDHERFEFDPSLVSSLEAQETEEENEWTLIKRQRTEWKMIKGSQPEINPIKTTKRKPINQRDQLRQNRPIYWTPAEWDNIIQFGDPEGETISIDYGPWPLPAPVVPAPAPVVPAPVPVVPAPAPVVPAPVVPAPAPVVPAPNPGPALVVPIPGPPLGDARNLPTPPVEFQRFALPKPPPQLEPEFQPPRKFELKPSKMGPITGPATSAAAAAAASNVAGPSTGQPSGNTSPSLLRRIAQNYNNQNITDRTRSKVQIQGDPTKVYLPTRRTK